MAGKQNLVNANTADTDVLALNIVWFSCKSHLNVCVKCSVHCANCLLQMFAYITFYINSCILCRVIGIVRDLLVKFEIIKT